MPFNGGGGGALPAHEHTNIANDGGPLDFNNTTVGSMNAGDITFSDGAALQTLPYPGVPAGETLQAVALSTAPSWVASAAPTATYEKVAEGILGVTGPTLTVSFAAINATDISELVVFFNGQVNSTDMMMQVNGEVGANYTLNGLFSLSGTGSNPINVIETTTFWRINSSSLGINKFICCHLNCNLVADRIQMTSTSAGNTGWESVAGYLDVAHTSLSSVTFFQTTGNIQAGSKITVFKVVN